MFKRCVNTSNKEGLVSLNTERQELIILQLIDVFAKSTQVEEEPRKPDFCELFVCLWGCVHVYGCILVMSLISNGSNSVRS